MPFTRNNYRVIESFTSETGREYAKVVWKGIDVVGYISRIAGPGRTIQKEWYREKKREAVIDWKVNVNTGPQAGGYKEQKTYVKDEPDEDYIAPPDNPLPNRGYLLENYPTQERVEKLLEITEDNIGEYDVFTWGVHTIKVDKTGIIQSQGERYINHTSDVPLAPAAFKTLIQEIINAVNESPGEKVIVTETRAVFFKYD